MSAYSDAVIADAPVLYCRQEEATGATTLVDIVGGHNWPIFGTPTFGQPSPAAVGGTSIAWSPTAYAKMSGAAAAFLDDVTDISIEFWVKTSVTDEQYFVQRDDIDVEVSRPWGVFTSGRKLCAQKNGNMAPTSLNNVDDGLWHHCVATINESYGIKVYMDGSLHASAPDTAPFNSPVGIPMSIGADPAWGFGTYRQFTGQMDELAIYDYTLTAGQVSAHYAARLGGPAPITGTLAAVIPAHTATIVSAAPLEGTLAATIPAHTASIVGENAAPDVDAGDPGIQASVQTTVVETPAWLDVSVSSATPESGLEFYVDGDLVFTVTADDAGQAVGTSVPLGELAAGLHDLMVVDVATSESVTVEFTVLADPAPIPAGPPSPVAPSPPPEVNRWTFEVPREGGEVYVLPINPSRMSSPHAARVFTLEHTTSPAGQPLTFEGEPRAVEWTVEGSCLTEAFFDALERFQAMNERFYVVDHLDRGWLVTFESLDWTEVRDRMRPWNHRYRAKFLIYAGPLTVA